MAATTRRLLAASFCLLLLLGTVAACTGTASETPSSSPSRNPSQPASRPAVPDAPEVRAVPTRVRVTRVAGALGERQRTLLSKGVGAVVTRYVDDAFLGGDQPRSDAGDAFASFTPGARRQAARDRSLLTHPGPGLASERVVGRRLAVHLSVLAPYRVAAGVTARMQLDYDAVRRHGPDRRVRVAGRLLLTRTASGSWRIFGYDLDRSVRPLKGRLQ